MLFVIKGLIEALSVPITCSEHFTSPWHFLSDRVRFASSYHSDVFALQMFLSLV